MAPSRTFDEYLAAIRTGAAALLADAGGLSRTDLVPTCPGWTVADLLAHHGGVCRWAATIVGQRRTSNLSDAELAAVFAHPVDRAPLLRWYGEAADGLARALAASTAGPALVFLRDAPEPRMFWARRSAHETTIHRADMLSATLGHLPTAAATGIPVELALDGLDELLMGFVPRSSSTLRTDERIVLTIEPSDSSRAWTVTISPGPPVTVPGVAPGADASLTGTAAALYLGLWNRGDEIAEHGDAPVLGLWRERVRVSWT